MKRIRQKLSSSDVKTPTKAAYRAPEAVEAPPFLPISARFATTTGAAQNAAPTSTNAGRSARDRQSNVLAVSSPMPLSQRDSRGPSESAGHGRRSGSTRAPEERERTVKHASRLQKRQPEEKEKVSGSSTRGRSLDVRGDRDRREHGKTYPTPLSSHQPSVSPSRHAQTKPSASRSQSVAQAQYHREERESGTSRTLPSPSVSPPATPRLAPRPTLSSSRTKEHGYATDVPAYATRENVQARSQSSARPPASPLDVGHSQSQKRSNRLPTPPSPRNHHTSLHNHSSVSQDPAVSSTRSRSQVPTQSSAQPHSPRIVAQSHAFLQSPSQISLHSPSAHVSAHPASARSQSHSATTPTIASRSSRSSSEKEKEKDKHNLRHKNRQVFHQPHEGSPPDLSTSNSPYAHSQFTIGSPNSQNKDLSADSSPSGLGDPSLATPTRKERHVIDLRSEEPETMVARGTTSDEFTAPPAPDSGSSTTATREPLYPRDERISPASAPAAPDYTYAMESASPAYPHGPVRGKPLIFAAMTSSGELEQLAAATPERNSGSHSNSYGYPSPPLEPLSVPADDQPDTHTPNTHTHSPLQPSPLLQPEPESSRTQHRHSYGAEGESSSILFSPHTSIRKLFKHRSRDEDGRKPGHRRSSSEGETHSSGGHLLKHANSSVLGSVQTPQRPSKLQKRGTHSSKPSLASMEAVMQAPPDEDAQMHSEDRPETPPPPPPKPASYGLLSPRTPPADLHVPDHEPEPAVQELNDPTSVQNDKLDMHDEPARDDPPAPAHAEQEVEVAAMDEDREPEPVHTPTEAAAKPPTPPMSPDEYSRSRSRRRGERLETSPPPGIAEVVEQTKGKARRIPITRGIPYPLVKHLSNPELLAPLLEHLRFWDWCNLGSTTKTIMRMFAKKRELRECVLERYLGSVGYSRWIWEEEEPLTLSIKDMHAYMQGVSMPTHQYCQMAQMYLQSPRSNTDIIRNLAFCTRSYNRVVLRLRAQAEIMERYARRHRLSDASRDPNGHHSRAPTVAGRSQSRMPSRAPSPNSFHGRAASNSYSRSASQSRSPSQARPAATVLQSSVSGASTINSSSSGTFRSPLYRVRRAPLLYVFVPSPEGEWLSDASVLECEAELKRAGVAHLLRPGDVVWDTAVGDEGNVGRMVWDGGYLLDLDYTYSMSGELPQYMHSLAFPPSYFHRVIRSVNNPICYLDISPWSEEIASNLQLLQDRVKTETPQGNYHTVVRWVHRSSFVIKPPSIKMRIPNTDLFIDSGWFGTVVVEAEGTNEGLADLQDRCRDAFPPRAGSERKTPSRVFRILRERSRPGEIWIRTVREKERLM